MKVVKTLTQEDVMSSAAGVIVDALKKNGATFMLQTAESLTVKTQRGYRKTPHIGGEDFSVKDAYVGRVKGIIMVFEPVMASDYQTMEMPFDECKEKLAGFEVTVNRLGLGGKVEEITEVRRKEIQAEIAETQAKAYDNSPDIGFGDW